MAHPNLTGVPGTPQVWLVDGQHWFLAYTVPGTDVPILYHVERRELLDALFADGTPHADVELTWQDAQARGAVNFGSSAELDPSLGDHPWDSFLAKIARDADIQPWLSDPEVLAHVAASWLRGETPNLERTQWWQSKTDEERRWVARVAANPEQARLEQREARDRTREELIRAGHPEPPDSLVNFIADQFVTGQVSEDGWQRLIRQQTDPFAPGASEFAGRVAPEGAALVSAGDERFVRHDGQFFRVPDDATAARFGDLGEMGAAGDRNVEASRDAEQIRQRVAAIRANSGLGADPESDQIWVDRVLGGSHSLADARAAINQKAIAELGVSDDLSGLFGEFPEGRTALGGEEDVQALLTHWLGPRIASLYDNQWVAEWAGRIRNNPDEREVLIDTLRQARMEHFPHWSPDLAYADRVPFYRQLFAEHAGFLPNESDDDFFLSLMQQEDKQALSEMLRRQGSEEGWEPVLRQMLGSFAGAGRQMV